jgi:hypothetical protein
MTKPRRIPGNLGIFERLFWRYEWFRRLRTPVYRCPNCRRAYHYCDCL